MVDDCYSPDVWFPSSAAGRFCILKVNWHIFHFLGSISARQSESIYVDFLAQCCQQALDPLQLHDSVINFLSYTCNCGGLSSCALNSFSVLRITLVQRSLETWIWLKDIQMGNTFLTDRCLRFIALNLLVKVGGAQNTTLLGKSKWIMQEKTPMSCQRTVWKEYVCS